MSKLRDMDLWVRVYETTGEKRPNTPSRVSFTDGYVCANEDVLSYLEGQAEYFRRNGELTPYIRDLIAHIKEGKHYAR